MRRLSARLGDVGTRRQFLALLGGGIAAVSLAACGSGTTAATQSTASVAPSTVAASTSASVSRSVAATKSAAAAAATSTRATTAASSATPPEAAAATPAAGAATLRWIIGDMSQARFKLVAEAAPLFEQSHPGVKVQAELSPTLGPSILTWAAAGTLYDVFFANGGCALRAVEGIIPPLDQYIARDHFSLGQFAPSEMTNFTWQGKVYGLPFDLSLMAVYYNKDMFKAAGVAFPPADGKWTYNDLLATAKPFSKSENGHQVQWGYNGLPGGNDVGMGFLEANGGKILSDDLKQCIINNPQNIATLEFFRDLVPKWHVAPGPGELPKGVGNPFVANLAAMQMQGSWVVLDTRTSIGTHFDWDVAPLPQGSTGKGATLEVGASWSIGKDTKQKDMAWELLKFVSSPQAEVLALGSGSLPGNVGAYPMYLKNIEQGSQPPQHVSMFIDVVEAGVFPRPNVPYFDQMMPILGKAISAIYAGQDAPGMLEQAQQQVNAIIPQYTF
jgi:multiple sugar transport system substrate-binding protein